MWCLIGVIVLLQYCGDGKKSVGRRVDVSVRGALVLMRLEGVQAGMTCMDADCVQCSAVRRRCCTCVA